MTLRWTDVPTRMGTFTVVAHDGHVVRIRLPGAVDDWRQVTGRWFPDLVPREDPNDPVLVAARQQIQEYVDGRRRSFDLPLKTMGTPFQEAVWGQLRDIPYGETRSYAQVAAAVGRPGAARAVGQANARNPIPIVQACHRVLASDGGLGGWMGATADDTGLKRFLIDLEAGVEGGLRPLRPRPLRP